MEHSSCTEDRIGHTLERCLYGLGIDSPNKQLWNAGMCINRWCLEELVKRDPNNFHILLQQILKKTGEVLQEPQYDLVVPLAHLFSSTLLKTPYLDLDCGVLQEAYELFHGFLSWPEPYCAACQRLLIVINQELRAPGISFQRMVRKEQGIVSSSHCSKTITVLLVSPDEDVPPEFLSVSEQLSGVSNSQTDTSMTLITHAIQAALGAKCPVHTLYTSLQSKGAEELAHILATVTEALETAAASTGEPERARESLRLSMEKILAESLGVLSSDGWASPEPAQTLQLPFAKCQRFPWDKDNFDFLHTVLESELSQLPVVHCFPKIKIEHDNNDEDLESKVLRELAEEVNRGFSDHRISTVSTSSRDSMMSNYSLSSSWSVPSTGSSGGDSDFSEDPETEDRQGSSETRKKPKKKSKSLLLSVERFSQLFKPQRSPAVCRRVQSMGYRADVPGDNLSTATPLDPSMSPTRRSLPPDGCSGSSSPTINGTPPPQKHVCIRRRPILSCEDGDVAGGQSTLVRVVVFGGDREAGRLARAYSDLQQKESVCPHLTRACRLRFYFVPVRKTLEDPAPERNIGSPNKGTLLSQSSEVLEDSTTDIARLIGTIDPWYERSVLSLLSLDSDALCQTASKVDADSENGGVAGLSLLADLVLYYCRHAAQPVLLQLYLAELTLAGGEKRKEVFVHSLELGHTAGTRAVKAMGAASKRFGIDGDREAVPLPLAVSYNKVSLSGRSQWTQTEMVCTSINLCKACKTSEQLGSRTESLQLTMTEVLKIQSSKSKKSFNQHISISEVKVNKVQVSAGTGGTTFAVCLDQDEKKIIQSVIRCDVSLCRKPGSSSDWRSYKTLPGQVQPLHPSYCSLLCLPIVSFSDPYP
ncbi:phosphoinositide 3-kinase regulatory subunit 5-like [Aplochiton taeniatus]